MARGAHARQVEVVNEKTRLSERVAQAEFSTCGMRDGVRRRLSAFRIVVIENLPMILRSKVGHAPITDPIIFVLSTIALLLVCRAARNLGPTELTVLMIPISP